MIKLLKKSVNHIFLMTYLVIILIPFLFVVFSSVKTDNSVISQNPFGLPTEFAWDNYVQAWVNANIGKYFFNSLWISLVATIATLLVGALASFAITRMRYTKTSFFMFQFILLGLLIPGNALLLPIYGILKDFDLLNKAGALLLPYTAFAIPFTVIILAAFMRSIPGEIEEAAVMDGLRAPGIFVRVILPLTVPALVTVFIVNFMSNWNEFLLANFFLSDDTWRTLPVGMVGFRDTYNTNYAQMSAGIVYSVVPVMVIYAFLQEKIIEGLTAGGVKG